jgi:hypothetical protein
MDYHSAADHFAISLGDRVVMAKWSCALEQRRR